MTKPSPIFDLLPGLVTQSLTDSKGAARQTLTRILLLRLFVALISFAGLLLFRGYSGIDVPMQLITVIFGMVLVSVFGGFWRLARPWPVTNFELFSHLLVDVLFLVLVLVTVGGSSNPLISYLLVLLAVGATFLTQAYAYLFAFSSIVIYSFFVVWDLRTEQMDHEMMSFQLHLVGMWVIFVVSAILIAVFVTRMSKAIRERELTLATVRENEIRNEQLVAIGTLAAGTAHALGTPLATMSVLLTELDRLSPQQLRDTDIKDDISILKEQVSRCRDSLAQLTRYYNKEYSQAGALSTVADFLESVRDYITNVHPSANISFIAEADIQREQVPFDPSLNHAVINLIENAIKAARREVHVSCRLLGDSPRVMEISVGDDGPGLPTAVMENMGEPFISTNKDSMGLGIYLANATVQKLGGSIEMFNKKSGGAMTILRLPLKTATPRTEMRDGKPPAAG
jgi:two-component system sensor histidine kinase RegB